MGVMALTLCFCGACAAEEVTSAAPDIVKAMNVMWTLIAAMLVFFMQAGFAMVETGFTRAKNATNIIMKNLMDFAIGSVAFYLIGFGFMFGKDAGGFIGFNSFINPATDAHALGVAEDWGLNFGTLMFFQTVFCATAATIVSGAMAERTKFSAYCIYSLVISLIIYPVIGHWIWGGGWLSQMGFHDFAGSTVVHSVGGWCALIGASILGPRIGKYDANGKPRAIPGHSITLGALGVFILWFGWFGFNPGSTVSAFGNIGHIALTTNMAAAAACVVTMCFTWIRYHKPDVSMTLNAALAGLVAITAPCDVVSPLGALVIGVIAGIMVVVIVEFVDKKLKVDDPVGAVAVHLGHGIIGTLCVGLFATPELAESVGIGAGLFYGGGFKQLGVQALGILSTAAWVVPLAIIMFTVIKKTIGLRVTREEETAGLDIYEHGAEAYPDFVEKSV